MEQHKIKLFITVCSQLSYYQSRSVISRKNTYHKGFPCEQSVQCIGNMSAKDWVSPRIVVSISLFIVLLVLEQSDSWCNSHLPVEWGFSRTAKCNCNTATLPHKSKNGTILLLPITSPEVHRFSKSFTSLFGVRIFNFNI